MKARVYEERLTVSNEHLDELGHVNNVVYLQWIQDIARAHWERLASDELKSAYLWVVLSHHIRYHKPGLPGDELRLVTFVKDTEGVRSVRRVEVFKNETLLVEAETEWCMIDTKRRRPTRIPDEIKHLFAPSSDEIKQND
ncbi:acyl-CoA thioesterase [Marinoscillum furvescens]|uniref:Acyl-CoA thioester hydrolase n=1 Tax=Marinoscillum furvescens DSM 4134 TaxID=1122208 RepID=A0A3D9L3V9_MARFU|nr:thioesterase family protein [Marinoscillum furvescens]REE00098.1 acyl-CoA thioester hydrolase [Marinoscillum furvescens DSM 4134]